MPFEPDFEKTVNDCCHRLNFISWFKTSAVENTGIDEAFECLINQVSDLKVSVYICIFSIHVFVNICICIKMVFKV